MAVLDFFLTDWVARQGIENSWPTDVIASFLTDAEERRALTTKPRRAVSVLWRGIDRNQSSRMLMQLLRSTNESIEVPLYSDQAAVTNVVGGVITCDTSNKRFFAGFKIVIVNEDLQTVERGTIMSLTPTDITLSGPLSGTYNLGSLVFPVIDALPVLEHNAPYRQDELLTTEVVFREIPGSSALPSLTPIFGDDPLGFPSISGLPVLNLVHNWTSDPIVSIARSGSEFIQGKGPGVEISSFLPIQSFLLEFSPLSRAEAFSFIEFFDSRRGRCLPFWIMPPHSAFRATADVGPDLTIEALENIIDIADFIQWVAVEEKDGTIHIKEVASIAVASPTEWKFSTVVAFPPIALADIARVSTGHLVRFTSDAMEELWSNDSVGSFKASVTELVNEISIEVTDL